jgi:hypothetical protein
MKVEVKKILLVHGWSGGKLIKIADELLKDYKVLLVLMLCPWKITRK